MTSSETITPTFTPRTPFVLNRSLLQVEADGRLGQNLQSISVFLQPVRIASCFLPRRWDGAGTLRTVRHARVEIRSHTDADWETVFESEDLPAIAPQTLQWPAREAVAVRLVILAVHEVKMNGRSQSERGTVVPFNMLEGQAEKFAWFAETGAAVAASAPFGELWAPKLTLANAASKPALGQPAVHTLRRPWIRLDGSLHRPLLQHFSWDSESTGRVDSNLLAARISMHETRENCAATGPLTFGPQGRLGPLQAGGGSVEAAPDSRSYRKVRVGQSFEFDLSFRLSDTALDLEIEVRVERASVLMEAEVWRWLWDHQAAITATLANPHQPFTPGARGRCTLPAIWHANNFGNLAVEMIAGDPQTTFLKVESHRDASRAWAGLEVGIEPLPNGDVRLIPGTHRVHLRFRPVDLGPAGSEQHPTLRRSWAGGLGFRPEFWGMSNNAASLNCLFTLHWIADMAAATRDPVPGLRMVELTAYSIECMLRDGPGYGYNRRDFGDSDPSLIIAAGVVAPQMSRSWLASNWAALQASAERVIARCNADGMIVCSGYTGNRGERDWSSNWWDVVTFGHLDAYVNALSGRAFVHFADMARTMGDTAAAERFAQAAARLRASYLKTFFNPDTGWLGGWRSADGELHDYAFLFINGIAIAYGMVSPEDGRPMLERLERLRAEVGYTHFRLGLPGNLLPIDLAVTPREAGEALRRADGHDVFGHYQNGGASLSMAYHYLRALGLCGIASAELMGQSMLDAVESREVTAGLHQGVDWRMWDGTPCGYEGLLADQFYALLAIQQNQSKAPRMR